MATQNTLSQQVKALQSEVQELRAQLAESRETLRAIQEGEVDALVVSDPGGPHVYTLQSADQPYRLLVEQMQQGAVTLNPDGLIDSANRAMAQMLHRPLEQLIGSSIHDYFATASRPTLTSLISQRRGAADLTLRSADGSSLPVHASATSVGGDATRLCLILTDLTEQARHEAAILQLNAELEQRVVQRTAQWQASNEELTSEIAERKRAKASLQQSEQRLREAYELLEGITQSTQDLIAAQDTQCRYLAFNKAYQREFKQVFGVDIKVGTSMKEALAHLPEEQKNAVELWQRAIDGESFTITREFGDPALQRRWYELRFDPLRDTEGNITGASHIARDVTHRVLEKQELAAARLSAERAKATAEEASRAKDQFLAVLSHELRTPLTPVLTTATLLQNDPDLPERYCEDIDMIQRNVELESRIIDDLLDVTRITRGKLELDRQAIELCQVIRRAVEVCLPDIQSRQLHFRVDLGPEAPYRVDADPARLQQVFWNLLKNATKFTPEGGCIGIRCRRHNSHVIAEVIDSGEGIAPELLPRLFNAFEQGGPSTTRQFGGLGLGLTITKGLVEMHGGRVEAFSDGKGKGALFRVHLPLAATPAARLPRPPAGPQPTTPTVQQQRPLRILLVEDHGDTARVLQRVLRNSGHTVQRAGDLATALELANGSSFDLLLSDLGLPDGSGIDLMRELRRRGHTLPGIALSGYGQEQDIRHSLEAGFTTHLTKPTHPDRLAKAIATVTTPKP